MHIRNGLGARWGRGAVGLLSLGPLCRHLHAGCTRHGQASASPDLRLPRGNCLTHPLIQASPRESSGPPLSLTTGLWVLNIPPSPLHLPHSSLLPGTTCNQDPFICHPSYSRSLLTGLPASAFTPHLPVPRALGRAAAFGWPSASVTRLLLQGPGGPHRRGAGRAVCLSRGWG